MPETYFFLLKTGVFFDFVKLNDTFIDLAIKIQNWVQIFKFSL